MLKHFIKSKYNKRTAQTADLKDAEKIKKQLSSIENKLQQLEDKLAKKCWNIDRVVIEQMHTDKIELNLDSIDVEELSGMLSIGLNYGAKLVKTDSKTKNTGTKEKKDNTSVNRKNKKPQDSGPVIKILFDSKNEK